MYVEIRGIRVGEDSLGGWVLSINLFSPIRNIEKGEPTICNKVFDESLGFIDASIWFR